MTPFFATISAETTIAGPRAAVFAHWLDPVSRQRWETPSESGMRYLNFASGAGEVEQIEITHDGALIGHMDQKITVIDAPQLIVSQIAGTFHGATTLVMQVVMKFAETQAGTHIFGTSQVCDLTGRDVTAEHEAGWAGLFAAFALDYAGHADRTGGA